MIAIVMLRLSLNVYNKSHWSRKPLLHMTLPKLYVIEWKIRAKEPRKPVFDHVTDKTDHVDDMRKHLQMSVDSVYNINITTQS